MILMFWMNVMIIISDLSDRMVMLLQNRRNTVISLISRYTGISEHIDFTLKAVPETKLSLDMADFAMRDLGIRSR